MNQESERELAYHRDGLPEALGKLNAGTVTADEAAKGLQHCANLIRDDNLPEEVGYETLKDLIRAALGKPPGSYRSKTTVPLGAGSGRVMEHVSAIRGVSLDLDRERRLVSISIHPRKFRERRRLMEIIGAYKDSEPDVAARHDDYLAMQDPHGAAFERLLDGEQELRTTSYTLVETVALLHRRLGFAVVSEFSEWRRRADLQVLWIDSRTHDAAWERFMAERGRGLSFVDWTTAVASREMGAPVFTFDGGFAAQGLPVVPR